MKRQSRAWSTLVVTALVASALAVTAVGSAPPAAAGNDGSLSFTLGAPDSVLYGDDIAVTLTAANPTGPSNGYNLSWRVVLPVGVSFVSSPAGNPAVHTDSPTPGQTTLVFENTDDLQIGVTRTLTLTVRPSLATYPVGSTVQLEAGAYMSGDVRLIPDFDATGAHVDNGDTVAFATDLATTRIEAIEITKVEPNAEAELLRGVHDEWTTYSLTVSNNHINPTGSIVVDDYLPAGVEFLACGGVDNTSTTPVTNPSGTGTEEYPGSGPLGDGVVPTDPTSGPTAVCVQPDAVTTVSLVADAIAPGSAPGVYTHVRWDLTDDAGDPLFGRAMNASEQVEIMYAAGIPLRENALFSTPPGGLAEIANLDNNTGPLTRDEQTWTNWAVASGIYHPGVVDLSTSDTDSEIVIAEDLSIHKTVDTGSFLQGTTPRWTLVIETGEYRSAAGLVVTDTLPDGQCPLLASGDSENPSQPLTGECNNAFIGAPAPTVQGGATDPDSVTENPDGTYTIIWNTLRDMTTSDEIIVAYSSNVRDDYQENFLADRPVVGGDSFTNTVAITGDTTPISWIDPIDPHLVDLDRAFEVDTPDASAASMTSAVIVIDKSISVPTAPGVPLDCDTASWTSATPPTPDVSPWAYRPGDRVCYRLVVDFPLDLDHRNPVVRDFIPPNTVFERFWGTDTTTGATSANDTPIAEVHDSTLGSGNPVDGSTTAIAWRLGTDLFGDGDLYVDATAHHFEVVFSVTIAGDPRDATWVDIVDNLAKLTVQNSAAQGGTTWSTRDQAGFTFVEPHLILDKRSGAGDVADDVEDTVDVVVQGDVVPYEVAVTNDFAGPASPADAVYARAEAIDGWDLLPSGISCADLAVAVTLDVAGSVACIDPGAATYPLTGTIHDGRSVIAFTIDALDPGQTALLTYSLTMPADLAAGQLLTNDAGIRRYHSSAPNTGGAAVTYVPASNIDPLLAASANTGRADASSSVIAPTTTVTKLQQSHHDDGPIGTNLANATLAASVDEATVGEHLTYQISATVPAGTDVYGATVTDSLNVRLDAVALLTAGAVLDDGNGTATPLTTTGTLTGYFDVDATPGQSAGDVVVDITNDVVTVTFPLTWHNPAASGDDTITVTFEAVANANADRGENIRNRATMSWTDVDGGAIPVTRSANLTTRVVEPNPLIAKTDSGTDTDNPPDGDSNVAPGDTVTYTLTVTNPDDGSGRVSTAYDLVVTDVLPDGVTLVPGSTAGTFIAGSPVGSEGTLTWTASEVPALATLEVGQSIVLTYTVTVDDPAIASSRLTNTATVTATSLPGTVTGERTSYLSSTSDTIELPLAVIAKDVAPFDADPFDAVDTDDLTAEVGEPVAMQVAVRIPAQNRVYDATVFDTLPSTLEYESASTPVVGGACERITGATTVALTPADVIALTPAGQTLAWWLGDIQAGATDCTVTIDYTVHVDITATSASTPTNQARLVWHTADVVTTDPGAVTDLPGPTDPSWDDGDGPVAETLDVIEPLLVIDKDVTELPGPTTCEPTPDADTCDTESGASHRFTVTVTNNGDGPAHDIVVVDTLPATGEADPTNVTGGGVYAAGPPRTLTWTVTGPLAPGTSVSFTYDTAVGPSSVLTDGSTLVDTADVTSYWGMSALERTAPGGGLINPDVPTYGTTRNPVTADTVTLTVTMPDLVVVKTPAPGNDATDARAGQPFRWRLVVHNDGSGPAHGVDVDDVLPPDWSYVAGSATLDTGSGPAPLTDPTGAPAGPLVWTDVVATLAPGAAATIEYDTVPATSLLTVATTGTHDHVNDAGVSGSDASGATANAAGTYGDDDGLPNGTHGADDATARIRRIDLSVTKSIVESAPYFFGDFVTYRVDVANAGPDDATGVVVTDVLDPGLVFQSSTPSVGTYSDTTGTWTVGSLASGASARLDIVARINTTGVVDNVAQVSAADQWDVDSTPETTDPGATLEDDEARVSFSPLSVGLGNRVWYDVDADGVQDPGEPGIPGVDVTVSWTDFNGRGSPSITVTTNADGEYVFSSLPNDTALTVTLDPATLPGGLTPTFALKDNPDVAASQAANAATTPDGTVAGIVLPGTTTGYLDVDFGYTGTNALGDLVWFDADASGTATATGDDQGIPGVDVVVDWAGWDGVLGDDPATPGVDESADDLTHTATTDAAGVWGVGDLPDGLYRARVDTTDLPPGVDRPTWDLDFGSSGLVTDLDHETSVTLTGADRLDLDFSYTGVGSVGDAVWLDLDADGVLDPDEVGLAGVDVTVTFTGPGGATVTRTAITDADGRWSVGDLPLDVELTVTVDPATVPANVEATHDLDDPAGVTPGAGTTHTARVTLTATTPDRTDVDFGYRGRGAVGDLTWLDLNASGGPAPDGDDVGLAGVDVTVTWTDPVAGTQWSTTVTSAADGTWRVDHLPDGDVTVTVDPASLPTGVTPTYDPDGGADGTAAVTLHDDPATAANEGIDLDQDFAWTGTGAVGDLVWTDLDDDGTTDTGEDPLAGVDVTVTWTDPVSGTNATTTVTTDTDGTWSVDGLPAGHLVVTVDPATLDPGLAPTFDLDGGDDRRAELDLGAGETRTDVDFGERPEADLAVTKTHTGDFAVGAEGRFTVTVTNHGPADATGVTVTDTLPAGLRFLRSEGTGLACTGSAGVVTCTTFGGDLLAGTSAQVTLVVEVGPAAAPGVTNTVRVAATGPADPDPGNDEAADDVTVPLSVLDVDKVLDGELRSGRDAHWVITVTNHGPSPTTGPVTVTDDLPASLSWGGAVSDDLSCSAVGVTGAIVTCTTAASLAVGDSVSVRITTGVSADAGDTVVNTAEVLGGTVVNGSPLPSAVLGDIVTRLADPSDTLAANLGIEPQVATEVAQSVAVAQEALAFTGASSLRLVWLGTLLVLLGAAAWALGWRRRLLATRPATVRRRGQRSQ